MRVAIRILLNISLIKANDRTETKYGPDETPVSKTFQLTLARNTLSSIEFCSQDNIGLVKPIYENEKYVRYCIKGTLISRDKPVSFDPSRSSGFPMLWGDWINMNYLSWTLVGHFGGFLVYCYIPSFIDWPVHPLPMTVLGVMWLVFNRLDPFYFLEDWRE